MIKLIATDLDGTLATHEGKIPEEAFQVIHELYQEGIAFAVATGRQAASVENDFREVLDLIYVIAENGGVVRRCGEDVHATYIDHAKAIQVITKLETIPGINFLVCCKDRAYQNIKDHAFDQELDKYYHSRSYREDLKTVEAPIIKIAIYHPVDIRQEMEPLARQLWESHFKITVSGMHWVDIGSVAINKGKALHMLQEDLGVTKQESMAFGDYFNDLEMFEQVDHSYAMAHALPEIKACAKFEAPTGSVLDIVRKVYSS